MKKKLALTLAFAASLIPMLCPQYGGRRGVQEITGLVNLLNPIGILSPGQGPLDPGRHWRGRYGGL